MDRLFSRCIMNVFCMYLELASTACMRCGDTWIMCGSHNTRPTCGIRPKYILIHDQIHVSVRGVSSPNWGGIMTMPVVHLHHGASPAAATPAPKPPIDLYKYKYKCKFGNSADIHPHYLPLIHPACCTLAATACRLHSLA